MNGNVRRGKVYLDGCEFESLHRDSVPLEIIKVRSSDIFVENVS